MLILISDIYLYICIYIYIYLYVCLISVFRFVTISIFISIWSICISMHMSATLYTKTCIYHKHTKQIKVNLLPITPDLKVT